MARIGWVDLLAYWQSLGDGREPPLRERFDPVVGVPRAVALLTLYGVEADGFRIRIMGSEVRRRVDEPLAGRMLAEVPLAPPIRDAVADALARTVRGRMPVLAHYLAHYEGPVRWSSLYLPLADEAGAIAAVVSGTFHELGEPLGQLRAFHADLDPDALAAAQLKAPD